MVAIAQQRLWVPTPPSVNELFRDAGYGADSKRSGRIPSQKYGAWRTEAGWIVKSQNPRKIPGEITLDFFHGIRSVLADASNYVKAFEDLLVEMQIIDGDSAKYVKRISSGWVPEFNGSVVHITPIRKTEDGGARWWVGFDEDVLGLDKPTVPSGRLQGQKSGTGMSEAALYRRRKKAEKDAAK